MAAFTATPFRGHGLSSVAVTTTFGAMHRLSSIVESRYARNYIPKFQAEFGVAEEEPAGPFPGLIQRYRQGFGHNVIGFQYPGTDRARPHSYLSLSVQTLEPSVNGSWHGLPPTICRSDTYSHSLESDAILG